MNVHQQKQPVSFSALGLILAFLSFSAVVLAVEQSFPGGFIENAGSKSVRPQLTRAQIQSFVPSRRGTFKFPPPYNTEGVRITIPDDCKGAACVFPVGYSYWSNINNHTGSDTMLIFLGLDRRLGGTGPTLFSYNKTTDEVKNLGALFASSSPFASMSGEDWYFSATRPTTLYVYDNGPRFYRYDVTAKTLSLVYDVGSRFPADKGITQAHSSNDDGIHSATLTCKNPGCGDGTHVASAKDEAMGCIVYNERDKKFLYFPRKGKFDECQIDDSGLWLVILEDIKETQPDSVDTVLVNLANGKERTFLSRPHYLRGSEPGSLAHLDVGYGYMVGGDSGHHKANAKLLYKFSQDPIKGKLVYYTEDWNAPSPNHLSHRNARADLPPEEQYACGSGADKAKGIRVGEILCFPMDGSEKVLIVAPVMTDMNVAGPCDDYCKLPKGNLDVTGRYFIWTTNLGGTRIDAFIVKVPAQLLYPKHRSAAVQ
jgi:hypothetical protein